MDAKAVNLSAFSEPHNFCVVKKTATRANKPVTKPMACSVDVLAPKDSNHA